MYCLLLLRPNVPSGLNKLPIHLSICFCMFTGAPVNHHICLFGGNKLNKLRKNKQQLLNLPPPESHFPLVLLLLAQPFSGLRPCSCCGVRGGRSPLRRRKYLENLGERAGHLITSDGQGARSRRQIEIQNNNYNPNNRVGKNIEALAGGMVGTTLLLLAV